MLAALATLMPEFVQQATAALRSASPGIFIVLGAVLFLFSGTLKWVVKWIGAAMVVYGLLTFLGYL